MRVPPRPHALSINSSPLRCVSSLSPSFLPSLSLLKNSVSNFLFYYIVAMMSTLPPSDTLLGSPFAAFDGGFTPWELPDLSSLFKPKPKSGSDEPDQTHAKRKTHVELKPTESVMEERKRRRMISNRESARRSRMRKQRHLDNLRNQVNRFRMENRELNNRLQFLLHHSNRLRTENEWLRSERTLLRQKLATITQFLVFQQPLSSAWSCNTTTTTLTNPINFHRL